MRFFPILLLLLAACSESESPKPEPEFERPALLKAGEHTINRIRLSPDGKTLATLDTMGLLKFWDWKTLKERHSVTAGKATNSTFEFSPDGTVVAVFDQRGHLTTVSVKDGRVIQSIDADETSSTTMAFSADGSRIATGGVFAAKEGGMSTTHHRIRIWDATTLARVAELDLKGNNIGPLRVPADGSRLVCPSDGQIWLLSTDDWTLSKKIPCPDHVRAAVVHSDGRLITAGENTIRIWDTKTWEGTREFKTGHSSIAEIIISADGKRLFTLGSWNDGSLREYDLGSGKEIRVLDRRKSPYKAGCATPDGKYLLTPDPGETPVGETIQRQSHIRFRPLGS